MEHEHVNALDLRSVSVAFDGGQTVVSDVSLSVAHDEFVSIVGPSGCGKSTLLRVASGLQDPSTGSTRSDGTRVGYVFQDPTLMPWRTVRDNAALLAELDNTDPASAESSVNAALELVGLSGHGAKYPHQLSGGMRMRTSLARTLAIEPSLLLLDEPFGSLDELSRERLNDELLSIRNRRGFAALMVTHSVSEAVYLSDRVLVMSPGPGRVTHEVEIPLGRDRNPGTRFTETFTDTCRLVHEALRGTAQ